MMDAFDAAWAGRSVVLVEASDLAAADRYRPYVGRRAGPAAADRIAPGRRACSGSCSTGWTSTVTS